MTYFIIGAIFGIAALLLLIYIMGTIDDRRIKKELGEDFENIIISKSEMEKYKEYRNKNYDRSIKEEIDENYETIEKPSKSKMDIQSNIRICMHDDEFTSMHLDDTENILAFISFDTKNVEMVDFYYSLMMNKKLVKIIYNDKEYSTVITEIKLISDRTLRIYYKVLY